MVPCTRVQVEVREEYSQSKPAQCYSLDAPSGAGPGAAATDGIGAAADESVDGMLPPLEISVTSTSRVSSQRMPSTTLSYAASPVMKPVV